MASSVFCYSSCLGSTGGKKQVRCCTTRVTYNWTSLVLLKWGTRRNNLLTDHIVERKTHALVRHHIWSCQCLYPISRSSFSRKLLFDLLVLQELHAAVIERETIRAGCTDCKPYKACHWSSWPKMRQQHVPLNVLKGDQLFWQNIFDLPDKVNFSINEVFSIG